MPKEKKLNLEETRDLMMEFTSVICNKLKEENPHYSDKPSSITLKKFEELDKKFDSFTNKLEEISKSIFGTEYNKDSSIFSILNEIKINHKYNYNEIVDLKLWRKQITGIIIGVSAVGTISIGIVSKLLWSGLDDIRSLRENPAIVTGVKETSIIKSIASEKNPDSVDYDR